MKPLSINRKSWLFKLACLGTSRLKWNDETNTCEYLAAIIRGIVGLGIGSMLIIFFIITPIFGIYAGFQCGFFIPEDVMKVCMGSSGGAAVGGMIMLSAWITLGGLFALFSAWHISVKKLKKTFDGPGSSNITKELYISWKDKTCKKIEIRD